MEQAAEKESQLEIRTEFNIASMVKSTGAVKLTQAQKDILFADVPEEQVEIRDDGIVYMPHIFYSTRLRQAFGWEFALLPKGDPMFQEKRNIVIWGFYAIVKGSLLAYAIGSNSYYEGGFMTYADAMEGAKSNAVMRLCKDLGIATQLWQPAWLAAWKDRWAYKGQEVKKGKTVMVWKKRLSPRTGKEQTEKDEEYLKVENSIRKSIAENDFTGSANLVNKVTGEIETYDMNGQREEILARLNSPTIYKMETLNTLDHLCKSLLIAVRQQESQVEGEDTLGDDEVLNGQPEIEEFEDDGQGDVKTPDVPVAKKAAPVSGGLFDPNELDEPEPEVDPRTSSSQK